MTNVDIVQFNRLFYIFGSERANTTNTAVNILVSEWCQDYKNS